MVAHSSYVSDSNLQQSSKPNHCQLVACHGNTPFAAKQLEAGVLMVAQKFCLWLQIRSMPPSGNQESFSASTVFPYSAELERQVSTRWEATIVLDRQGIAQVLQGSAWSAIVPLLAASAQEQWQNAAHRFWQSFLHLTQPLSSHPLLNQSSSVRSQAETTLLQAMLHQMPVGMFQANLDGSFLEANTAFCQLIGYSSTQLSRLDLQAITYPEDFSRALDMIQQIVQFGEQRIFEKRYVRCDGSVLWAEVKLSLMGSPEDETSFLLGFVTDLSDRRQIEFERLQAIQEIHKRQERESLLNNLASRIRSTLDLPTILQNAAGELKKALGADRVVVYQIFADQSGSCASEAVNPLFASMQGMTFGSDCIPPPYLDAYRTGRLWSVEDVSTANLADCHQKMLAQVQVKSMIATSILSMDESLEPEKRQLWGLLTVHHCQSTRQWTSDELNLVEAVANQLAIALEQTKLLNQLTTYTHELEDRVSQRTHSLARSLKFEQFIRSLTECLHREFNEKQLFDTVVQGLVSTLKADLCLVSLYDPKTNTFTVKFEAFSDAIPAQFSFLNQSFALADLPTSLQHQLLHHQTCHWHGTLEDSIFLKLLTHQTHPLEFVDFSSLSEMVCSIGSFEAHLGILLVLHLQVQQFDAAEVKLIEQTTDYCTIALRQANLYRQEHEQRLSAEYLRSFLEKSTDVYVEYDAQLRYISINPVGCALLGHPLEEIIGKTNQELLKVEDSALDQLVQQALDTAEQVFVDHELLLPEGKRVFESVYAPITDPSGTVQRVLGVCRDISEFKHQWQTLEQQNQQLAETTRIKEEFVATTSHELRTPLTAILGFSNILMRESWGELNSKQKEYIERIYDSGQHLLDLINDILDLSRLEAGRMELDLQAVYIPDICESVVGLVQERAMSQGLTLEIELEPTVQWIVADPRRVKQMLLNLLMNAIKFTPQGSVGLKVFYDCPELAQQVSNLPQFPGVVSASQPNLCFIHFLVWDTGIGIAEADQRSLFSPFSQIDSSLSRKHQGTGLGLVITEKLAKLHGGKVSLESQAGVGSKFTVTLPLRAGM
ncbi:MAG: PAS domain S-box protein [Leptolyngbyaceae cyanobacterium bins.302]|nr:PAS domain S-box protein [Leptolyngbyaceae cyanobacterium bins.302]